MTNNTDTTAASGAAVNDDTRQELLAMADRIAEARGRAINIDPSAAAMLRAALAAPAAQEAEPAMATPCGACGQDYGVHEGTRYPIGVPSVFRPAIPPAPQADAGAVPDWDALRHSANEWADMATNGLQWMRNVVDGTSDSKDALANLERNLAHCRAVNDAPSVQSAVRVAAAPQAPAAPATPACSRCQGSGEDPEGYYDQSKGDAGHTHDGPCRDCSGTGEAPAAPTAAAAEQDPARAAGALEKAWRAGWAACRDAEYVGQEAEDEAWSASETNALAIDIEQSAPAAGAAPTDAAHKAAVDHAHEILGRQLYHRDGDYFVNVNRSGAEAMHVRTVATIVHAALISAAAPAQEAAPLTQAELQEVRRAVDDIEDCGETDVAYGLLLRAAVAGYLECTRFQVLNQSALDLDAARARLEGGSHG